MREWLPKISWYSSNIVSWYSTYVARLYARDAITVWSAHRTSAISVTLRILKCMLRVGSEWGCVREDVTKSKCGQERGKTTYTQSGGWDLY